MSPRSSTSLRPFFSLFMLVLLAASCSDKKAGQPPQAAAPVTTPALPVVAPTTPLTTVIVHKDAALQIVNQSLQLDFAVIGGTVSSSLNDFRFQCKRENESDFTLCPSGSIYRFANLQAGTTYELTVQALSISTGASAIADTFSFTVAASQ